MDDVIRAQRAIPAAWGYLMGIGRSHPEHAKSAAQQVQQLQDALFALERRQHYPPLPPRKPCSCPTGTLLIRARPDGGWAYVCDACNGEERVGAARPVAAVPAMVRREERAHVAVLTELPER